MEGENEENLSLDEIIKLKNIQAPSTVSGKSTSSRGRGFVRPVTYSDPAVQSAKALLEAAYNAGLAAGRRALYSRGGYQRRGNYRGGSSQRGGYQRGGYQQRMGNLRTGIPRPTPGIQQSFQGHQRAVPAVGQPPHNIRLTAGGLQGAPQCVQLPLQGMEDTIAELRDRDVAVFRAPAIQHDVDRQNLEISIPTETVGKPALRDRLGWYPWQRLTPAQQAARSKLSLAKMRLNGQRPTAYGSRFAGNRMTAARHPGNFSTPRWQPYGQRSSTNFAPLEDGVSPLLRHNVARLPGDGGSRSRSVKSFSGLSRHSRGTSASRMRNRNNAVNKAYLAERQFDGNDTELMSAFALQERMRPQVPYGKYNRCGLHVPTLDLQMQKHIAEIQQKGRGNPVESEEDFEYAAIVVATRTTSSDRFSLMMGLGQPAGSSFED